MAKEIVFHGWAGPVIGVLQVDDLTGDITTWRCCVLCGWLSTKCDTTPEDAAQAGKLQISEQSEHVRKHHPEMIPNVIQDTGGKGISAPMGAC